MADKDQKRKREQEHLLLSGNFRTGAIQTMLCFHIGLLDVHFQSSARADAFEQLETIMSASRKIHLQFCTSHITLKRLHPQLKSSKIDYSQNIAENYEDEAEGIQSKERCTYVKVNMDGILVGRKICILDRMGYSTLALQLEEMFGKHSISGLRLFQAESEFTLLYKDRDEHWRTVGDCPWKEFIELVKRLRIVPKDETLVPSSSALFNSL